MCCCCCSYKGDTTHSKRWQVLFLCSFTNFWLSAESPPTRQSTPVPPRRTLWSINQPPATAVRALLLFLLTTRKTSVNQFDFQPFTLTREQKPPPPLSKFPDQFPITYFSGLAPSVIYFFRLAAVSKLFLKSNKKQKKKKTNTCLRLERKNDFF